MNELVKPFAEGCAAGIEVCGLLIIVAFAIYSLLLGGFRLFRKEAKMEVFRHVRHTLGHGILLGLEFLVAADIIHTVAVDLSFRSVGVLALVVLIRTFLSFTLDLELTGKWPWQKSTTAA